MNRPPCPACCSIVILRVGAALDKSWLNPADSIENRTFEEPFDRDPAGYIASSPAFQPNPIRLRTKRKMTQTRRDFLAASALGALGAALPLDAQSGAQTPTTAYQPADARSTDRRLAPRHRSEPAVTAATFTEAEKLVQIEMSLADRAQAAGNWRVAMAPLYERRTGPRKMALEDRARAGNGLESHAARDLRRASRAAERATTFAAPILAHRLPANDADIAFASVAQLSRWIQARQITSERLTRSISTGCNVSIPKLHCVITLTRDHALEQARQADAEIAAGKYRGPLHGIPWGAKDLLDTAGIPTTYGAEPYRNRVPTERQRGRRAAECGGRGAGGEAEPGRAGAERCLVWRADHESVAAGRRRVGIERRPGSCDGGRAGWVRDRQRNRRQHCESVDALRCYRTAANLRTRCTDGRHDAVLVARQAGADGAKRRRHDSRAQRDLRAGLREIVASVPSTLAFDANARLPGCAWATSLPG